MIMGLLVSLCTLLLFAAGALFWRARQLEREQSFYLGRRLGQDDAPRNVRSEGDVFTRTLQGFMLRAGMAPEQLPGWLRPCLLLASVALALLALLFSWVLALMGLVVVLLALLGWVMAREASRQNKMREQLPGFLEHMMRVLNAGNALEEALAVATQDCPQPLAHIFSGVTRQVRLGAAIDETLTEVAYLSGLRELQVMALAIRINRRFGGSLKRIFKSLVGAIHQQDAARREMRALTAETRVSAVVLAIVPTGMMLYILAQNPAYYLEMWFDPAGRSLLFLAGVMQVLGVIIIWRMLQRAGQDDG
jgi:tight adherence protein B